MTYLLRTKHIFIFFIFIFIKNLTIFSQEEIVVYTNAKQEAYLFFESPITQTPSTGNFSFKYSPSHPKIGTILGTKSLKKKDANLIVETEDGFYYSFIISYKKNISKAKFEISIKDAFNYDENKDNISKVDNSNTTSTLPPNNTLSNKNNNQASTLQKARDNAEQAEIARLELLAKEEAIIARKVAEQLAKEKREKEKAEEAEREKTRLEEIRRNVARKAAEEKARKEAEIARQVEKRLLAQRKAREEAEIARQVEKRIAEEKARIKAENKAKEKARKEAEKKIKEDAKKAAIEKAKLEAEIEREKEAHKIAEEKARLEAKKAAIEAARRKAEEKAKLEAELAKKEAKRLAIEEKAKIKANIERIEIEKKAAEEKAKLEAELAKKEAERIAIEKETLSKRRIKILTEKIIKKPSYFKRESSTFKRDNYSSKDLGFHLMNIFKDQGKLYFHFEIINNSNKVQKINDITYEINRKLVANRNEKNLKKLHPKLVYRLPNQIGVSNTEYFVAVFDTFNVSKKETVIVNLTNNNDLKLTVIAGYKQIKNAQQF